ncbi:polysaccharide pyruvyl transferase [Actinomadura sp. NBRC 104425]|uniref:polysaccharide pyruvyl transferase family protein n=1 Tax=Actinomadura sp. NBRC 104425 TaxID=3032204 RepID=UPI0024A375BE|nr:polysaccharide pyruvyl transferase family protein [Actinomadura sp. NBRC 104425]GLZ12786.1 polysaccharide pyruvyl transferase [Actinomadura sp. NBRC 104425]
MRVLVVGWPSFVHGEATAGDVLALEAVRRRLAGAGLPCDVAWSPVFRPGALTLEQARPEDYTHVVFACGPLRGEQVEGLHRRYARCRRVAVGVSVIDPGDPAAAGFHAVLPRDAPGRPARCDLAASVAVPEVPVVGVVLVRRQREYGARGRHERVERELTGWLGRRECARLPLETRLDPGDWRLAGTAAELESAVRRLDLVVTTRMHGLVLALKNRVPALAVDPVAGGAKVTAQARAWAWPAVLTPPEHAAGPRLLDPAELERWWRWCLSGEGAARARACPEPVPLADGLLAALDLERTR